MSPGSDCVAHQLPAHQLGVKLGRYALVGYRKKERDDEPLLWRGQFRSVQGTASGGYPILMSSCVASSVVVLGHGYFAALAQKGLNANQST